VATNQVRNGAELYQLAQNQIQSDAPELTDFNEGSILDILIGAQVQLVLEAQRNDMDLFAKAFIETSNGPVNAGDPDDLQRRIVDLYGSTFARPGAIQASAIVQFKRPNTQGVTVTIPAGTIVKTAPDASGTAQRFATLADEVMVGLTISAQVQAVLAGSAGNVLAQQINLIESTLTDQTITVQNAQAASGGSDGLDDSSYREYARNLLIASRGATLAAIQAKALTVPGVVQAVPVEQVQTVIQYVSATNQTVGAPFQIARNYLYIADVNGSANAALIAAVQSAIESVRADGVKVTVIGAAALVQNVVMALVLNANGPNYATLVNNAQGVIDTMTAYIQNLPIGAPFSRLSAVTAVMNVWGPNGSNDLTGLLIQSPTGDVAVNANQTLVPGSITTA
jgi:hypothetical protein